MMLWCVFAAITIAVLCALLWPLLRKQTVAALRADYDMLIYRDQLAEVEKDVACELLNAEQAATLRTEIHRRMLAAQEAEKATQDNSSPRSKQVLALILLILVPLGAGGMYLLLGSPELPGKPYAERLHDPDFVMAANAEKLAAELESKPNAEGYKRLADMYLSLRRYTQVADTLRKFTEMDASNAGVWSLLGEAIASSQDGMVTPDARQAFTKALQLDPHNERARFFMGLAEAQIGDTHRAVAIWRDLEKDSPADAPWMGIVKEHIAIAAKEGGFTPESVPPAPPSLATLTAPSPDAAAAIMAMPAADQQAMIHAMVDRLAAKMKANPNDIDGWLKLAKAYRVLGETNKAEDAEQKAAALKAKTR